MPTLFEDFMNPVYFHALWVSIVNGLKVLVVVGVVGAGLTFMSGGTQPRHWPSNSEH